MVWQDQSTGYTAFFSTNTPETTIDPNFLCPLEGSALGGVIGAAVASGVLNLIPPLRSDRTTIRLTPMSVSPVQLSFGAPLPSGDNAQLSLKPRAKLVFEKEIINRRRQFEDPESGLNNIDVLELSEIKTNSDLVQITNEIALPGMNRNEISRQSERSIISAVSSSSAASDGSTSSNTPLRSEGRKSRQTRSLNWFRKTDKPKKNMPHENPVFDINEK